MALSLPVRTFGKGLTIHSLPEVFFFCCKWSVYANQLHFLAQDQSTVAQRQETFVAECSLTSCVWVHLPDRFPHLNNIAHSNLVGSRVYVCLGVICHLHFWQNDRGLLCATAVTRGGLDTKSESAHKVNSVKKIPPLFLLWLELATFWSQVWCSTNKLSWSIGYAEQ